MKTERKYMELAIEIAMRGVGNGNSPFGSVIVNAEKVISVAHNTVLTKKDATNHAEINAIRLACKKLKNHELRGCIVYSTTEPCPMCFSAIHWAKIDWIVYGTTISDVKKLGFSELSVSNKRMKHEGHSRVKITQTFMRKECLELLKIWKSKKGKTY